MNDIKRGTIVTRKSYNDDILFKVEEIINTTILVITGHESIY